MKKYLFIFLFLFMAPVLLYGADCTKYVSNSGSGSTCSVGSPCAVSYAFANAVADDVWCFRGGTYNVPAKNSGDTYIGYYNPANSGTSGHPIIFQAYPSETPLFNGTAGGSGDSSFYATIMSASQKSYITFDGFSFQSDGGTKMARVIIGSNADDNGGPYTTTHITIQNCTFNGGNAITDTDNYEGLRLNKASSILVKGNTLYNYIESSGWHNTSATKAYHTEYVTYENNKMYNNTTSLYDKSGGHHNIYRYNWIYSSTYGMMFLQNSYPQQNGAIYHNLIHGVTDTGIMIQSEDGLDGDNDTWSIYNNTIYTASAVTSHCLTTVASGESYTPIGYSVYNNLIQCQGTDYGGANFRTWLDASNGLTTMDYNNYGSHMSVRIIAGGSGTNYTTVNALKAAAAYNLGANAHDTHSIASAPTFANGSGNLNTIADFALTVASAGHNAGSDGKDMGADVSLVGPSGGGGEADTTAPVLNGNPSIGTNGTTVTANWTEASGSVSRGAGWNNNQINLDCSTGGNDIGLTYVSGDASTTWTFTAAKTIYSGETCNLDFDGGTTSIVDPSSNYVTDITNQTVTNGSTQPPPDITAPSVTATDTTKSITADSYVAAGSASDAVGVSGCKWRLASAPDATHGTACTGTTSWSCSTSGYGVGSNTLYVGCYDAAGNYGTDTVTVTYTPPVFSYTSGSIGGITR